VLVRALIGCKARNDENDSWALGQFEGPGECVVVMLSFASWKLRDDVMHT
jgi:hypothetical protein